MIIPFFIPHAGCPHQCVFCNQKSITGRIHPPEAASIPATIRSYLSTSSSPGPVQVAFYGGSFTALPQEHQISYLEPVQPFIETGAVSGIRLSTRPDAISIDVLRILKQYRVGTVELGAQSMDNDVLRFSGRGHSTEDTRQAVQLLLGHAFQVGLQLMPGLPGDSNESFGKTVKEVVELRPNFVRLYPALVIRDTPLEALYRAGRYCPLTLDEAVAWCRDAMVRFEEAGIDVIRIGLQPTKELERTGTIVAGPYHAAFRQLVMSSLMLERMSALLGPAHRGSDVTFSINPRDISFAIGQKRCNVRIIQREFGLASIRFCPDSSVPKGQTRFHPACISGPAGV